MEYDSYLAKVDLVIAELTDMRQKLELGRTEVMAGRCPPVIGNDTKTLECMDPAESWNQDQIREAFNNWMNRINGLLTPPG